MVETHGGGKGGLPWLGGISFPWRLPANATLPPYRGRRRRHRRRRVCSCSCAPWFRFRSPPRPRSPPRCPPSSRLELPPTPPGAPSPSAPSLRRSPFASVRSYATLRTPRHQAFPPPPLAAGALPSNSTSTTPATSSTLLALLPLIVSSLMRSDRKRIA